MTIFSIGQAGGVSDASAEKKGECDGERNAVFGTYC